MGAGLLRMRRRLLREGFGFGFTSLPLVPIIGHMTRESRFRAQNRTALRSFGLTRNFNSKVPR